MRIFWLRSVRRRPAAFVVLALVSLLAVSAAVLSPLLLRAVQESALRRAVQEAGTARTAVFGLATAAPGDAESGLGAAVAIAEGAGHLDLWRVSTPAVETNEPVPWSAPGSAQQTARIVSVGQGCGGLRIAAGRCVAAAGEVLVPSSAGVAVGGRLRLDEGKGIPLSVVGVYSSLRAFAAGPQRTAGAPIVGAAPDLVVDLEQLDALQQEATAIAFRPLARPFRLDDVPAALDGVAQAAQAQLTSAGAATNGQAIAHIGDVLAEVQPDLDRAAVLLGLVALDAVGLAWFAVGTVVQRLQRARAAERGLARLRGLPPGRRASAVLLEPAVAVALGGVLGLPVGAATAVLLAPGPVDLWRAPALVAAGLAFVGSLVVLGLSSLSGAPVPLADLLRATAEPRRASRAAVAVQAVVVLAAGLALYSLLSGADTSSGGIAFAAPVLLALLVGVLGARAAALLLGRPARRPPRDAARLLAGRRLGRSPSVLTGAVAVLVGVAVAAFTVQLAAASTTAQHDRADATVGAPTVLTVSVPAGGSLRALVDTADPTGREAMAAAELPEGRDTGRLLAVDTARLGAVTTWRSAWAGIGFDRLAARLAPRAQAPLVLTGTTIRMRLADVRSGPLATEPSAVRLRLLVAAPKGWVPIDLGTARNGLHEASAPCAAGCRVVALQAVSTDPNPTPFSLDATVQAIATDRQGASRFEGRLVAADWRNRIGAASDPSQPASASVSDAGGGGLAIAFQDAAGGGAPGIAVRDVPEPIPVLLGPDTRATPFAGVARAITGIGLDQDTRLLVPVGRAAILPRTLGTGALADLTVLERSSDPAHDAADEEVWLAAGTSSGVEQRLRAAGVRVLDRETVSASAARYERDAPALGAAAAPVTGLVALLLVLLARLGGGLLDAPARRRDAVAAALAGVPRRVIRRAVALEVAAPLAVAVAAGLLVGVAAFLLIAPHLVLTAGDAAQPPLDVSPALLPLSALVVASLVLGAAVSAAIGRVETREEERR